MIWYYVSNNDSIKPLEIKYETINSSCFIHGYMCLEYIDNLSGFHTTEHFTSYEAFIEWRIAAERRAAWSIGG